ncbi:TonB-dependent siderophore receptor [Sphingobacterium lactis]|uniref:Iron complex outermembrane recepter protein n=1 Tax=Sphingobacterium lactis TaxID=797291 RepID=A0A1H6CNE9_9SPHI|nr:TonB-dependent receptor [Sphingobacterium lactis]SEG74203.1 iron complex outermembrane recepter protein [Sphingobacterium lactis]
MKVFILLLILFLGLQSFAQTPKNEQVDTLNTQTIDEITINTYIKKDTEFTNKMPLRAIENAQVYSSIDKIFFQNQQVFTLDVGYRNVTGIQKMWSSTHRAGDGGTIMSLRGFLINNPLRNGLVAPITSNIDAINLEKLEVLKGPSATLYGSNVSSYGGVINRVTKQPLDSLAGQVSLISGSNNYYRAQTDINTPLSRDKKLLFRLNAAYTNEGTFQKPDAKNTYLALAPSLSYQVSDKFKLTVDYEGNFNEGNPEQIFFYLTPALGASNMKDLSKNLNLDYKESYSGNGLTTKTKIHNIFGQGIYQINDHIKSSTHINHTYTHSNGFSPYFYLAPKGQFTQNPEDKDLGVARADQSMENSTVKIFQIQQNVNLDYRWNEVRNRTVIGFDYMRTEEAIHFMFTPYDWQPLNSKDFSGMNSNSLTETYNKLKLDPKKFDSSNRWNQIGPKDTYSAYISNVITPLAKLNIMMGIRYESNTIGAGTVGPNDVKTFTQAAWSPKLGVVYELINDKFSIFGNYQNSFKSNGYYIADNKGTPKLSDPETANQLEGGIKAILFDDRFSATLNYYDIQVRNTILRTGEMVPNTSIAIQDQSGKLQSKGMELEISAYLVRGFSILGGVSYNDSKLLKAAPNIQGRRPTVAAAPWQANFYSSYLFLDGKLSGLGIGLGGNYASDNKILDQWNATTKTEEVFKLPAYFIMNANVFYDTKKYRIGVNFDNFTNQKYWIGYTTANAQRLFHAMGSLTYKF